MRRHAVGRLRELTSLDILCMDIGDTLLPSHTSVSDSWTDPQLPWEFAHGFSLYIHDS